MPWTRASALTRALNCPASVYLPQTDRPVGDAARWGTEVHAAKAGLPPTPRVSRWLALQAPFRTPAEVWPGGRHEVGLGLLVAKGRVDTRWVGPAEERHRLGPDWVTGCADWLSEDGILPWVDDLKTGIPPDPPTDQLLFYAAAAFGPIPSTPIQLSITHWPRYPLGAAPTRVSVIADPEEFEVFTGRLIEAKTLVEARAPASPGPWCRWCPCTGCPHHERFN